MPGGRCTRGLVCSLRLKRNAHEHIADWLLYFMVAMIWGDHDDVTPLAQANDLLSLVPPASLRVMRDVGHIPQIEDPAAFNAALIDAIRQLASADPAVAHAGRN